MSSSPEDSPLILPPSDKSSLKNTKYTPDFPKYRLIIINRSISRTESCEEMDDGDFIIKKTSSHMIYRDCCNRKKSLEFLYQIQNIMINYKYFYLDVKHNNIFNECFTTLDEKAKETKKSKKQFAIVLFRKKDGSFDKSRTEVHYRSGGAHSEDEIFKLLLDIYHENSCDFSEIYIYSTNSPCLARHNHVPCMIQAFFIANRLNQKHGIKTIIGYVKSWGLSGSCQKNVPSYSNKDCIHTFDSQNIRSKDIISASSQKTNNDREEEDKELLIQIYRQIISEVRNQKFVMGGSGSAPECKLKHFYSKISNSEIRKQLHEIEKKFFNLLKTQKSDLLKTSDGFHQYGLEMFEKCTKEISDLLIDDNANIIEEICNNLRHVFFPWWDKKVEDASSKFLKDQLVDKLLNNSLHLFILEIKKIEKKLERHFFEIGYVAENV